MLDVRALRFLDSNIVLGSSGGDSVLLIFEPVSRRTYLIRKGRTLCEPALAMDMASGEVIELGIYVDDISGNYEILQNRILEILHLPANLQSKDSRNQWLAE
jgi:hypothetical protein